MHRCARGRHDGLMSTHLSPPPSGPAPGPAPAEVLPATPAQLDWLRTQVPLWQASGLIGGDQGSRIVGSYHATRRFSLGRLLLGIGALFVGVGVIWLVAANLDELAPTTRFLTVVALWLACLLGAEALAARGTSTVVVGAVRLLAALGIGAVVFQAAQSLQVPAYEPRLVGLWGAAALLHAYAVGARGPLLVGIAATVGWALWQPLDQDGTFTDVVLVLCSTGVLAIAVAALHERWSAASSGFSWAWRHTGAALLLAGLFAAGIPVSEGWDPGAGWWTWLIVLAAGVAAAAALATATGYARSEVLTGLAVIVAGVLLVTWEAGNDPDRVGIADWGHAVLAVVAYVALAVAVAVLGTLRDSGLLTFLATGALVVFTTFQSFAVFAPIVEGAWLFVVLGVVFLLTGVGFDRARRRIAETIVEDEAGTGTTGERS